MVDQVDQVLDALQRGVESTISALSTNITAELIERTPVDTGWARANWVPGIGAPFTGNTENLTPEERQRMVPAQGGSQQTATAALLSYQIERGNVFISNNVPYIVALSEGSSTQAPSGFVQDGILAGIRSLNNVVLT